MKKKKKTLEEEINEFLGYWDANKMCDFLRDVIPLFELYDLEDEGDWVTDAVGEEDERNVRLIRTVYLVSRIAEFHAGKLCEIKMTFKDLWKKMEKHGVAEGHEKHSERLKKEGWVDGGSMDAEKPLNT